LRRWFEKRRPSANNSGLPARLLRTALPSGLLKAGLCGARRRYPWVREASASAPGTYACIIEIKNDGDEPETLLGATIDGAGTGVIYQIIEKDGKFSSKPVEHGLLIKPHGSIELTPTAPKVESASAQVSK
jgi:hypothetical protein